MEREDIKSIIESLLFVADGPLTIQRLSEVLEGVEKEDVRSTLDELQAELENSRRGVRLVEVAGGYQLRTAKVNADWVKKFLGGRPARMGRATLETLAIIAYRQPITRAEIEAIRGVDVDGVINTLLDRSLIRAVARKDVPGDPFSTGQRPSFCSYSISRISPICRRSKRWKRLPCRKYPARNCRLKVPKSASKASLLLKNPLEFSTALRTSGGNFITHHSIAPGL